MATATYDLIASQILASNTVSTTFSSITSSYTDLRLVIASAGLGGSDGASVRVNGDTSSIYSDTYIVGIPGGVHYSTDQNNTYFNVTPYGGITTASTPFYIQVDFFNYSGSTYKTIISEAAADMNGTTYSNTARLVGLWRNTSAINSITVTTASGGNYHKTGSVFFLYGIKAA